MWGDNCRACFSFPLQYPLSFFYRHFYPSLVISASALFDQFCTSSLFCAGNHSQRLALSPLDSIYIIFSRAFIDKLRHRHANPRTKAIRSVQDQAFHTRIGPDALSKGSFIIFYIGIFVLGLTEVRVQFTPLRQTNNKSFPSLFCQLLLSWMRVTGAREFMYENKNNVSCGGKWIISFVTQVRSLPWR